MKNILILVGLITSLSASAQTQWLKCDYLGNSNHTMDDLRTGDSTAVFVKQTSENSWEGIAKIVTKKGFFDSHKYQFKWIKFTATGTRKLYSTGQSISLTGNQIQLIGSQNYHQSGVITASVNFMGAIKFHACNIDSEENTIPYALHWELENDQVGKQLLKELTQEQ